VRDCAAPSEADDEVTTEESIGLLAIASDSILTCSRVASGIQLTIAYAISRSVRVVIAFVVLAVKRIRKRLDISDDSCVRVCEELRIVQHCVGNLCGFYRSETVHPSIKPTYVRVGVRQHDCSGFLTRTLLSHV
jgi:hypothetical protein